MGKYDTFDCNWNNSTLLTPKLIYYCQRQFIIRSWPNNVLGVYFNMWPSMKNIWTALIYGHKTHTLQKGKIDN